MSKARKKSSPFLLLSNDSSKNLRLSEISVNNSTYIQSTKNFPSANPLRGPTPDPPSDIHRLSLSPNPKNVCVKLLDRKMTSGKSIDNLLTYNIENSEITRIQGLLLAKEEEITKLKTQLEASMNDNTYKLKEKEARDLAKKLAESNLAEERLRKELSKELEDWKAKYISLEKRAERTKLDFEQSKEDVDKLKVTMSSLESELEQLKRNNNVLEEERGKLQRKLDANELNRERSLNEEFKLKTNSLEADLKSALAENARLKDDLAKWKVATGKIEAEWSKKCLETEQFFSNELRKKMAAEQERQTTLSRDLERHAGQNSEFQEKVALLSCEIERLRSLNDQKDEKAALLSCELERLHTEKGATEERTALLCCELERLKSVITEREAEKEESLKGYLELKKALEERIRENDFLKTEKNASENSQMQKIFTLSCEVEALKDRLLQKEREEQLFKSEISEKQSIQGEKEYWKEQFLKNERNFQDTRSRLELSNKTLAEELGDWKRRHASLEAHVIEVSEDCTREKLEREKHQEMLGEMRAQYSLLEKKKEEAARDLEKRVSILLKENQDLKVLSEELKHREKSLQIELSEQKLLVDSISEKLKKANTNLERERDAVKEKIKQYEDLEIRYSAQGNVERLLVEAKREKIIAESNFETQSKLLKDELARLRNELDGLSNEGSKESARLLSVIEAKNHSINDLQEKLGFLNAKLQAAECPIPKETRSLMAERLILLSIENERLNSKIKIMKEESSNMRKNYELDAFRAQLEYAEELSSLSTQLMIYKRTEGRRSNSEFFSFGVSDFKNTQQGAGESEPLVAPNAETYQQSKLEKLIAGEQVLTLKNSLEERVIELEELKSRLKMSEEEMGTLRKRNEELLNKLQESSGLRFMGDVIKSSSSPVFDAELANLQREVARLNQENSSLKLRLEENLEELYERDDRLYALTQKLKQYESDSKRNVYSFEDFENLERKLRDLEVQIMKLEKDHKISELQYQLQSAKGSPETADCLSLTISLEEKMFQNKIIILENEYLQEEIAIMRSCLEGDSSTQRDVREGSLDFRFYKRKVQCLEEENLAALERNDSENSLARILVGLARKNKELKEELGGCRYLQRKMNRILRKDARGGAIILAHEASERIELLQKLLESFSQPKEKHARADLPPSELSLMAEARYWQDQFIRANSSLVKVLALTGEGPEEGPGEGTAGGSKSNCEKVSELVEALSQRLSKRADAFKSSAQGTAEHSRNVLLEETVSQMKKVLHQHIQDSALEGTGLESRKGSSSFDALDEMIKDFELEYWRSVGGGSEAESIDLYRSLVQIITKDLENLEKENAFLKSMLSVEVGIPSVTELECLDLNRLDLISQTELNLKSQINKYRGQLEELNQAISQEKAEKVKKSSESQQHRTALDALRNELDSVKSQVRERDERIEQQRVIVDELSGKCSTLEQKISSLEGKNKHLTGLVRDSESKYEILENEADQKERTLRRELDELSKGLKKSESQNAALALEMEDLNEKLKQTETDLKRSVEQKERKIVLLAEENSRLKSESDNINEKILSSLESTINDLKRELRLREESLREEKNKRERDISALQEALHSKEKEIEETEEYYEAKTRNYDLLLEEKEKFVVILEQDRKNLSERLKAVENEQSERSSALTEAKVDRLKRENEKLSNIVVDKNREITQLQQRITEVEAQIAGKINEEIASREAYYQTQIESEIKSLMEEFKNKENLFESEKERTLKENAQLQQIVAELSQEASRLKEVNRRVRAEITEELEQRSTRQVEELRKEWEQLAKRKIESEVKTLTLAFTAERSQNEDRISQLINEKHDVEQKYLREVQEIKRELVQNGRSQLERELREIREKAGAERSFFEREASKSEQRAMEYERQYAASQREKLVLSERARELERENESLRKKIAEIKGSQETESENVQKMLEVYLKEEIITVNQRCDKEKQKLESELQAQMKAKSQLEEKTLDIASKLQETLREKKRLEKENRDLNTQVKSVESEKENIFSKIKDYWNSDMKEKVEFEIKLLISKFQKEKAFLEAENRKLKALVNIKGGLDFKSKTLDQEDFEKYRQRQVLTKRQEKKQGKIQSSGFQRRMAQVDASPNGMDNTFSLHDLQSLLDRDSIVLHTSGPKKSMTKQQSQMQNNHISLSKDRVEGSILNSLDLIDPLERYMRSENGDRESFLNDTNPNITSHQQRGSKIVIKDQSMKRNAQDDSGYRHFEEDFANLGFDSIIQKSNNKLDNVAILDDTHDKGKYIDDDTYLDQLEFILKGIDDGELKSGDLNNFLENNLDDDFDLSKGKENFLQGINNDSGWGNLKSGTVKQKTPHADKNSIIKSRGESPVNKKKADHLVEVVDKKPPQTAKREEASTVNQTPSKTRADEETKSDENNNASCGITVKSPPQKQKKKVCSIF